MDQLEKRKARFARGVWFFQRRWYWPNLRGAQRNCLSVADGFCQGIGATSVDVVFR